MIVDNHGRTINYVRLAVTDRCNLRCTYCMPEEGLDYLPHDHLLTYEELLRMVYLLAKEGVNKVRITGGEPFVRKNMMFFLSELVKIPGIDKVHITSNGTILRDKLEDLKSLGIDHINLSLDTLNAENFQTITRTDSFDEVMTCLEDMMYLDFKIKINMVVMKGKNHHEIIDMAELARTRSVGIRYIEEMPFNGSEGKGNDYFLSYVDILKTLRNKYSELKPKKFEKSSTSMNFNIPGFMGDVGIIAAYSRTFCGSCNRIRITPTGSLKTCLYDQGVFNLKGLMRNGASDEALVLAVKEACAHRAKDGWEAEKNRAASNDISESMATIGG